MDNLPTPKPVHPSSEIDSQIRAILAGMTPGWYTVASLWPRYLAWCRRTERAPATRMMIGLGLRRLIPEFQFVHNHSRAYKITEEWTRGEDAVSETPISPLG